jgi:hypothetical protein
MKLLVRGLAMTPAMVVAWPGSGLTRGLVGGSADTR